MIIYTCSPHSAEVVVIVASRIGKTITEYDVCCVALLKRTVKNNTVRREKSGQINKSIPNKLVTVIQTDRIAVIHGNTIPKSGINMLHRLRCIMPPGKIVM